MNIYDSTHKDAGVLIHLESEEEKSGLMLALAEAESVLVRDKMADEFEQGVAEDLRHFIQELLGGLREV